MKACGLNPVNFHQLAGATESIGAGRRVMVLNEPPPDRLPRADRGRA